MEEPKRKNFKEGVQRIDKLAKSGHFKEEDLPGTDTYDDGMNEKGEVIMPGSTSTGSGGIYMEDIGPNDMRRRDEGDIERAEADHLSVLEPDELGEGKDSMYEGGDPAAEWLRKNDPKFKKRGKGLQGAA